MEPKKTNKRNNFLIAFISIIIGIIALIARQMAIIFNNQKSPILIGYFGPVIETFYHIGVGLIIIGIAILVNLKFRLTKKFDISGNNFDIEKFKQDESYTIVKDFHTIKRQNHEIIIDNSKKNVFKLIIWLTIIVLFLVYIIEPLTVFVLTHLDPNNPLFSDANNIEMILFLFMILVITLLIFAFDLILIKQILHRLLIIIDLLSGKITYKENYVYPINLLKRVEEITLPIENIESLSISYEPYKVIKNTYYTTGTEIRTIPGLCISTNSWNGNEKLLKKVSSRDPNTKDKLLLIKSQNIDDLNSIKELLAYYATKG